MADEAVRYRGTAADLAAKLRPFVARDGASWLKYSEEEQVTKATVDKQLLLAQRAIYQACKELQANVCFTKATVRYAMQELIGDFREGFGFSDSDVSDWVETMTRRLRNMFYIIRVADNKDKKPQWLVELNAETAGGDGYKYGFDKDLRVGWRVAVGDRKQNKELSLPLQVPADAPDDTLKVKFEDGSTWEVPDMCNKDFEKIAKQRGRDPPLWQGRHSKSHNLLQISQRPDRNLLCSLFEQTKQVLQVRMSLFGPLPEPQPAVHPLI